MDNLKYYNESLAYDFEMFMPKSNTSPKKKDNIIVMPKAANRTKARNAKAAKAISAPISMLLCCIVVLAGLCGNIALRLRINEVNDEIKPLYNTVMDSIDALKPGGRLCILTFHSLEDRAVKNAFNDAAGKCICPPGLPYCVCGAVTKGKVITRKPMLPTDEEMNENSRCKSAKLRIFEKK